MNQFKNLKNKLILLQLLLLSLGLLHLRRRQFACEVHNEEHRLSEELGSGGLVSVYFQEHSEFAEHVPRVRVPS